mgnify:CR=1 FL=1
MAIIVKKEIRKARLDEGMHNATVKEITVDYQVQTQFGIKDVANIFFEVGGVVIKKRASLSIAKNSTLLSLIKDITGIEPKGEFDLETLIGKKCQVLITHNQTDNGDVWENIEKVRKAPGKTIFDDDEDGLPFLPIDDK